MEKLGQEPAFPIADPQMTILGQSVYERQGISKRFYAACAAMQGLITNEILWTKFLLQDDSGMDDWYVKRAYMFADELLKQENE